MVVHLQQKQVLERNMVRAYIYLNKKLVKVCGCVTVLELDRPDDVMFNAYWTNEDEQYKTASLPVRN